MIIDSYFQNVVTVQSFPEEKHPLIAKVCSVLDKFFSRVFSCFSFYSQKKAFVAKELMAKRWNQPLEQAAEKTQKVAENLQVFNHDQVVKQEFDATALAIRFHDYSVEDRLLAFRYVFNLTNRPKSHVLTDLELLMQQNYKNTLDALNLMEKPWFPEIIRSHKA
ncbi:MAG: hypothetical protein CMO81_01495 [Waddliaceae bacterium]|nr:hypothetical protein [Waddliaceae bacterium]